VDSLTLDRATTQDGNFEEIDGGWRLSMKAGEAGTYRLAQLDNYRTLSRVNFPYRPELRVSLQARASAKGLPGTWGFGLWNDPFGFSLGFGGSTGRLPALPNAAWFFFASQDNHLSFHDHLPGNGAMAAVFRSPKIPTMLLAFNLPLLPLVAWRPASRWMRRRLGQFISQDAMELDHDVTAWHEYAINWQKDEVAFSVDGQEELRTAVSPLPPLGLVIWIDNQYAAWPPDGRVKYGTLANPDCWMEIKDLKVN
jgi:hypothetical protein